MEDGILILCFARCVVDEVGICVCTDGGWTEGTKQILFNWIEECAGAGAGHYRGGEGTRHHSANNKLQPA